MRTSSNSKLTKLVKAIFLVFVAGVFLYLILGQMLMPLENREKSAYTTFSEGWVWIKNDGTREQIEIPGKCGAERNELIVVENTVPYDVEDNIYLCIRSSKQEMQVYVDGKLRQ